MNSCTLVKVVHGAAVCTQQRLFPRAGSCLVLRAFHPGVYFTLAATAAVVLGMQRCAYKPSSVFVYPCMMF